MEDLLILVQSYCQNIYPNLTIFGLDMQEDIVDDLREFLCIEDEDLPILTIMDIPHQQLYKCDKKEITADIINDCLTKYKAETLEFTSLTA